MRADCPASRVDQTDGQVSSRHDWAKLRLGYTLSSATVQVFRLRPSELAAGLVIAGARQPAHFRTLVEICGINVRIVNGATPFLVNLQLV